MNDILIQVKHELHGFLVVIDYTHDDALRCHSRRSLSMSVSLSLVLQTLCVFFIIVDVIHWTKCTLEGLLDFTTSREVMTHETRLLLGDIELLLLLDFIGICYHCVSLVCTEYNVVFLKTNHFQSDSLLHLIYVCILT